MPALTAARLLDLWDAGQRLHPLDRAVLLAAAALPEPDRARAADLAVGARDAAILRLRQATLGDRLAATAVCPACATTCEVALSIEALLHAHVSAPVDETEGRRPPGTFRAPTSRDLAVALVDRARDPEAVLCERCATGGVDRAAATPGDAAAQLAAWMARYDPLADIQLALACPGCGGAWSDVLDPAAFFWREIDEHARALLDEVARLAAAYGWSEADVLAMSAARRAAYLQRVR